MRRTNKPVVNNDGLFGIADVVPPADTISVGSESWFTWLTDHDGFVYEGKSGHLTARSELRRGIRYWYGHRRREGKLAKTYLGKSDELTLERLEQASAILAGKSPMGQAIEYFASEAPGIIFGSDGITGIPSNTTLKEGLYQPLTKFKPPVLPQKLIARPRLSARINAPATLISAPSGFGKTTLVNEWRVSCGMPVAWVTLSPDDNQPQRFWATVVMALQTIDPIIGKDCQSQLHSTSHNEFLNSVTNLNNDIVRVGEKMNDRTLCLVLDDFHHIQNAEIHSSLQTWLEQLPPKFQLVIASNSKLALTLGNLRAKGIVVELKADDLRFSLNEGVEFLKQYAPGNPLAINDMQVLIKRTEGWVAGLVLAASIVSRGNQRSHVLEIFTGAHVFLREFFMESVLHQQPEEVKNFLLRTSILEQLTGPLCNAVTGRVDGEQILARLWEDSSFMERIEESGRYRYHEMFAEMLRAQLNEQFPAEITRLHRKAAKWYRTHTFPAEAISHYLLGRSWEEAAVLIEAVALNELERFGEDSRLLRWIQQLPDEVVVQHRTLLLLYIRLARLVLPSSETEELINRTEHNVAVLLATQKTGALQETYNAIRNVRHLWTTNTPTVFGLHLSKEYDAVGQMLDDILQFQRNSRIHLITAEAKASEVYKNAVSKGHLYSILIAGGEYANLAFSQGFLRRSEQIAQQVLKQANEFRGQLPQPASIALTALSGVYFERNQLAQSYDLLKRAIEISPDSIRANESIKIAIMRAKIQSMEEEPDAAIDTIETIRALSSQHPSSIWFDQDLAAYQALFRLHQGDFLSAERHLGGGWEIDQQPFSAFIRASILVQQNRNLAAEEILRYLLNRYPHSFYWVPILRARVLLSIALFKQQKIKEACQVMVEAARIAAPEYFVRPFLSADPQIAAMLSLVLHTENLAPGTKSFIKGTLAMVGHVDGLQTVSGRDEQISYALSASISPREQEILQSLGMGLSNQEIADKFSISSSTVKTHLENIFRKLGVSKRTQAIAKAHALGLIEIMAKKF